MVRKLDFFLFSFNIPQAEQLGSFFGYFFLNSFLNNESTGGDHAWSCPWLVVWLWVIGPFVCSPSKNLHSSLLQHPLKFILTISFQLLFLWLSMKCSSLVLLTSDVKFQVYSRLKLTQRCSSPAGLVSNLNLLKFMSQNKHPHYLLRAFP